MISHRFSAHSNISACASRFSEHFASTSPQLRRENVDEQYFFTLCLIAAHEKTNQSERGA